VSATARPRRPGPATAGGAGVTPSRVAAAMLLTDLRQGHLLDASFDRHAGPLDARDRRWVQELVWGLLRSRARLDAQLSGLVRGGLAVLDADVLDLLRLGAYQLLHMGSVPPYAAIGQTVELCKRRHGLGASKLVNAVLRRLDRERETLTTQFAQQLESGDRFDALALEYSHPRFIVQRWVQQFGEQEAARLLAVNNTAAPMVLRPHARSADVLADELAAAGVTGTPVPLVPDSLQLDGPVALADLGAFRQGHLYVQDPAATLVVQYAHVPEDAVVADLCAAPGSKALELARRARVVVAADRSLHRVRRMQAGFARLGDTRVLPVVADALAPSLPLMDAVLVDAPCTGTGTFRRHPDARWRLRVSDVPVLAAVQKQILKSAASLVRPGGLLVYSTCSLEPEENEEQVQSFLASHPEFMIEPPPPGIVPDAVLDNGLLRVLPQVHDADGAFAARMRRRV
jgi:16S rRNA (cytosine967-C5)-methyltransferase